MMEAVNYEVIYADPPWRYEKGSAPPSKAIENHYPTMTIEELCGMNIPAANNAVLYMWATCPKLKESLQVMESWGFTYRTNLVWDKVTQGIGYWFRGQHELLIVGVKGSFSPPEETKRISSVWRQKRTVHSRKPVEIREMIHFWYPDKRKIELFGRTMAIGWDIWGNQVNGQMPLISNLSIGTHE